MLHLSYKALVVSLVLSCEPACEYKPREATTAIIVFLGQQDLFTLHLLSQYLPSSTFFSQPRGFPVLDVYSL